MGIQDYWHANLVALVQAEGAGDERRGYQAVAERTGLSEEYIYQLVKKKPRSDGKPREVGKAAARKIEQAYAAGRPTGWFDRPFGVNPTAHPVTLSSSADPQPEYAGTTKSNVRRVVIVGTARLAEGEEGFYEEISSVPGAGDGHIDVATGDPNAYGLRMRGNSMFPSIRDGWYVLIEPNARPAVGEYVLVKLRNGQKMVKELLIQRPDSIEVMSVNGSHRHVYYREELESIQAVAAVVPPSKWKPD